MTRSKSLTAVSDAMARISAPRNRRDQFEEWVGIIIRGISSS